ncbi:uncharacterized MFS-type transporter C09D4.1-like [Condylostylus longicornis]|uniref:uncharacterized MFS-type transporter C09D4.1-like n=1 Tax=Condylostylus longicornis TaxID=2530218 RepID=UPI00244DD22E|nr:uncharacterized MFS-type transporter C09D4.1-like [Condylostylus longicornis]
MDPRLIPSFRRNSTILVNSLCNIQRNRKSDPNTLPEQNENFLCVPHPNDILIRGCKSQEFQSTDPQPSLKRIESFTSLSVPEDFKFSKIEIKLLQSRWLYMIICIIFTAISYMQWIQFSIIANLLVDFYKVSSNAVDWTSLVFMICYVFLVLPVSYFLDTKNSRQTALYGCFGTALGSWIKMFALNPNKFYILMIGQTIVAISQIFILQVPQTLSAVWFSPNEAFTVSGLAAFGGQLGIALGFFITPWLVKRNGAATDIRLGIENICIFTACLSTIILVIVFIGFKGKPKYPPSTVQAILRTTSVQNKDSWKASLNSLKNKTLHLLLLSYGIHTGVQNSFSTLLNQIILNYFPNSEQDAGNIGAILISTGLFGSLIFGFIIDMMQQYKSTALWVSRFSVVGMIFFYLALESKSKILLYISSMILGFFMTGYQTVGQELALEIEYYNTESPVAALLNISSHVFGITFTVLLSWIEMQFGTWLEHICFILLLVLGTIFIGKSKFETNRKFVHEEIANEAEVLAQIESVPNIVVVPDDSIEGKLVKG